MREKTITIETFIENTIVSVGILHCITLPGLEYIIVLEWAIIVSVITIRRFHYVKLYSHHYCYYKQHIFRGLIPLLLFLVIKCCPLYDVTQLSH